MSDRVSSLRGFPPATQSDLGPEIPSEDAEQILEILQAEQDEGRLTVVPRAFHDGYCVLLPPTVVPTDGTGTLVPLEVWSSACFATLRHLRQRWGRDEQTTPGHSRVRH